MKLSTKTKTISSDGFDDAQRMSVSTSTEATAKITRLVAQSLYKKPKLSALREIACNALDAHIEAGQTRPVEVTLPNPLDQKLVIRDFGHGMTPETIATLYSQIFASSKDDNDALIGVMGIGSKAPFAITSQFSIRSITEGVSREYLIALDDNDVPTYTLVHEAPTTEPSGVTVTIPVPCDVSDRTWQQASEEIFAAWPTGSVLVDGEPIATYDEVTFPVGSRDGISVAYLPENPLVFRSRDATIVMSNVAYSLDVHDTMVEYDYRGSFQKNLIISVPPGAVDMQTSREELVKNQRAIELTKTALMVCKEHGARIINNLNLSGLSVADKMLALALAGKLNPHYSRVANEARYEFYENLTASDYDTATSYVLLKDSQWHKKRIVVSHSGVYLDTLRDLFTAYDQRHKIAFIYDYDATSPKKAHFMATATAWAKAHDYHLVIFCGQKKPTVEALNKVSPLLTHCDSIQRFTWEEYVAASEHLRTTGKKSRSKPLTDEEREKKLYKLGEKNSYTVLETSADETLSQKDMTLHQIIDAAQQDDVLGVYAIVRSMPRYDKTPFYLEQATGKKVILVHTSSNKKLNSFLSLMKRVSKGAVQATLLEEFLQQYIPAMLQELDTTDLQRLIDGTLYNTSLNEERCITPLRKLAGPRLTKILDDVIPDITDLDSKYSATLYLYKESRRRCNYSQAGVVLPQPTIERKHPALLKMLEESSSKYYSDFYTSKLLQDFAELMQ